MPSHTSDKLSVHVGMQQDNMQDLVPQLNTSTCDIV